ncbi:MAG TPA: efflux RND transporter permease subunit, partial [Gemmataceae bacterium]|nr:efflux RND transporter permease subunit [Gemmataceae bacterium]
AWVISIVIVLVGLMALLGLPIAQYPDITPPTINVACQYPGANAQVVADTVAAPIEQQINGVENMMYMSSQSNNDGSYSLTVTFKLGVDLDAAQVLVQNRVQQALPSLPDVVKQTGVTVKKQSPSILLVVNLYSDEDPATHKPYYSQLYLSNYATIQVKDVLARVDGVGDVLEFGQQDYSMRVWLDPDRLASRNLTAVDVINALKEQNIQVAAGQIGQQPAPAGLDFQYTMTTQGRLSDPKQFDSIVVKTGADGQVTYLRDVSRSELGARSMDTLCRMDAKPSVGLAAFQLPTANALDTADRLRTAMRGLGSRFPQGLKYAIVYDTTPFIRESVDEVFKTLVIAVLLVAVVVLLFLQDWKAVMLPLIDVVVSLVGTFTVMRLLGFTLNNLTLFGLVLAIGIVVDDAIVVLENIERWLARGLSVRDATIKAMDEITGPILAITLVLSSVFIPSAFLGGITGQFYRQFALTISASMMISALNAMTLTPARAAAIFGGRRHAVHPQPLSSGGRGVGGEGDGREALPWWFFGLAGGAASFFVLWPIAARWLGLDGENENPLGDPGSLRQAVLTWALYAALFLPGAVIGAPLGWLVIRPVNWALAQFFRGFNWLFDAATRFYARLVGWNLRLSAAVLLLYLLLIGAMIGGFFLVPGGFIPSQDKGYLIVNIQLPDSASQERTVEIMDRIQKIAAAEPGVAHTVDIPGQSFVMNGVSSNFGSLFVVLKPFHDRRSPELYSEAIAAKLRAKMGAEIKGAQLLVFGAAAVDGLGNAGGFRLMLEGTGGADLKQMEAATAKLCAAGSQAPGFVGLFSSFRAQTPQLFVDVDRVKCKTMKVDLNDVFATLQAFLGSYYVNDFNKFGRTWQVNVQADAPYRINAEVVKQFKVRNASGDMVPLGSVATVRDDVGPVFVLRYNMNTATAINGLVLPSVSTGTVISTMEQIAGRQLPRNMTYEWTELTYMQKEATRTDSLRDLLQNPFTAFVGAVVLVFLVLAALYESWTLPLSVILVVPMCLLCAIAGVWIMSMDLNIFVQVGFVVLVGLASKNAILIVEFARDRQRDGASVFQATVDAARVRLRPIIMTSFAFIMGVAPLVVAGGAGAEMRRTLGTAVFAGMLGVTLFGIFLTPVFFYVVRGLTGRRTAPPETVVLNGHPPEPSPDGESVLHGDPFAADGEGDGRIAAGSQG